MHRKTAVLIPYYILDREVFAFLQKRTLDAPRFPSFFGFFGGHVEDSESIDDAVKREIKEELNIDISTHNYFNHYEFSEAVVNVYIMMVDKDFSDTVEVLEGQYGKFLSENDVMNENEISPDDRVALKDFFEKIKISI